jgi:triosephosphate isomerase
MRQKFVVGNWKMHTTALEATRLAEAVAAGGPNVAATIPIQCGGSVVADNALAFLRAPGVDGALVGGASLAADPFPAIVRAGAVDARSDNAATAGRKLAAV